MKKMCGCFLLAAAVWLVTAPASAAPHSAAADAFPVVPAEPGHHGPADKDVPFRVAVFRDVLPWGSDRVGAILASHGIPYTVFGSSDIGAVDLESYDKVILGSAQPDTFVQKVSSYRYWFDRYAEDGGYLLCSLSQQSAAMPVGTYYPGSSFLANWALHDQIAIDEPAHPVFNVPTPVTAADLSGWSASSHGDLGMGGATFLASHDDGSGTYCLAERAFGYGFVMATTMTFEFGGADYEFAENLVLHRPLNPAVPLRVAIFRDALPWGSDGMDQVLADHDIPFTVFGSADMGAIDLSVFDKVILANAQSAAFFDAVIANRAWFEAYAAAGGVLFNGMCPIGSELAPGSVYPGGAVFAEYVLSSSTGILLPDADIFSTPNVIAASDLDFYSSSHGWLEVPDGAVLAVNGEPEPGAVLVEQAFGDGLIVSTTLTTPLVDAPTFTGNYVLNMPRSFPRITSVADVANDQGRQVRLTWERSGYDGYGGPEITGYEIQRRQDDLKAAGWDFVTSVPAHGDAVYQAVVPTLCDSTDAGTCWSVFRVLATTGSPYTFYASAADSGFSVDNLAPAVPTSLVLAGDVLGWDDPRDEDFDYFTVYGSDTPDLTGAVPVGHTTAPSLDVSGDDHHYLLVTATDFAGNESAAALADAVSGVGDAPAAFRLVGAVPNPFNPSTVIRFDLPAGRTVTLRIYDASGRLVRTLLDGRGLPGGRQDARWDGRDDRGRALASGVYFYRLDTGFERDGGRMTLLR